MSMRVFFSLKLETRNLKLETKKKHACYFFESNQTLAPHHNKLVSELRWRPQAAAQAEAARTAAAAPQYKAPRTPPPAHLPPSASAPCEPRAT